MFNLFLVTLAVGALGSKAPGLPDEKDIISRTTKDGEVIATYTIKKLLGQGQENAAYIATRTCPGETTHDVVLKTTFKKAGSSGAEYEASWLNEMHKKDPDHFPKIYGEEYFTEDGVDYIAMEYLEGYDSLLEYVKLNAGKIPGHVATEMMVEMLSALNSMHTTEKTGGRKGRKKFYAHGDFHGENIMVKVDSDSNVRVMIIDPHPGSPPFKIPQPHTDMVWAARHFITLTRGEEEIREL